MAHDVLRDRRFGQLESQLQEFPVDAWCTPTRVGQAHSANQVDDLLRYGRPALPMAALPAPVQPEASSVPGDHCFWLDDQKGGTPAIPELRQPSPKHPLRDTELYFATTLRTLKNQELMTKGQNLRVDRSSASETLPERKKQRQNDRAHESRTL
jgi:hypothetical protein